jgi:NTP pyrophosphatase (non-canonical NTP hydrolase)
MGDNMATVTDLAGTAAEGLRALQDLQRCYDDEMWDISDPAFSKLRHIHIHLSSTIGKVARALEPLDHQDHRSEDLDLEDLSHELAPVVADLLIHAAQISSALGQDLSATLMHRYRHNARRFAPASEFATL